MRGYGRKDKKRLRNVQKVKNADKRRKTMGMRSRMFEIIPGGIRRFFSEIPSEYRDLAEIIEMKEEKVFPFLIKYFGSRDHETGRGYLYYKGNENLPLLVAHIDTVTIEKISITYGKDGLMRNSYNLPLGADDRAGVYAIMQIGKEIKDIPMLFTSGEETGGIGAHEFCGHVKSISYPFMIEFDRKGRDEMVFYNGDNDVFRDFIKGFGFNESHGTFSDISILGEEWDKNSVNLSVGYIGQHTNNETLNPLWMLETIFKAKKIISDCRDGRKQFDKPRGSYAYSWRYNYGNYRRGGLSSYYDRFDYTGRNKDYEYIWDSKEDGKTVFFSECSICERHTRLEWHEVSSKFLCPSCTWFEDQKIADEIQKEFDIEEEEQFREICDSCLNEGLVTSIGFSGQKLCDKCIASYFGDENSDLSMCETIEEYNCKSKKKN